MGITLSKVLVVEDDLSIQKVIRMSLKSRGVNEVVVASDGEECLALADRVSPDVILLDITMPKLDGYDTCRFLKSNEKTRLIPVIFLSAKAQNYEKEIGYEAGAVGYLTKPFDPMTLHEQILNILEKEKVPEIS
jgi:CheY-like chemotaxis protein